MSLLAYECKYSLMKCVCYICDFMICCCCTYSLMINYVNCLENNLEMRKYKYIVTMIEWNWKEQAMLIPFILIIETMGNLSKCAPNENLLFSLFSFRTLLQQSMQLTEGMWRVVGKRKRMQSGGDGLSFEIILKTEILSEIYVKFAPTKWVQKHCQYFPNRHKQDMCSWFSHSEQLVLISGVFLLLFTDLNIM